MKARFSVRWRLLATGCERRPGAGGAFPVPAVKWFASCRCVRQSRAGAAMNRLLAKCSKVFTLLQFSRDGKPRATAARCASGVGRHRAQGVAVPASPQCSMVVA